MATRFYFPSSGSPPVTPNTADAAWEHAGGNTAPLLTTPDSSALSSNLVFYDAADDLNDKDALYLQAVSDPLAAQTIGVQGITAQIQCFEDDTRDNLFLAVGIRVISNDGATVRATILAVTRDTTNELPITSIVNRNFPSTNTSSYTCIDGDRIQVEIGAGGLPTSGGGVQGHNYTFRLGCSASSGDLPANDTETGTTFRPWLEFADTLTFSGGGASVTYPQLERGRRGIARGIGIGAL